MVLLCPADLLNETRNAIDRRSAAVAYFASDAADFVTGTVLDVNGGHFMG